MPQHVTQDTLNTSPGLPPHGGMDLHTLGKPLGSSSTVVILVHGRGAGAAGIAPLAEEFALTDATYIIPEASGRAWYPFSFLSPIATNEPGISSGLSVIDGIITECERREIPTERIALAGFSQGACLALEYAVRHPRRYKAVLGFSGGLIGPDGTSWKAPASFDGTPVFLGCSDRDMHIPAARVRQTAEILASYGATVDMRLYPGMPHTINDEEISIARELLSDGNTA